MSSLEGKVALVTGAASKRGMGHSIAVRLANEGADVIVVDKIAKPKSLFPGDEGWGGLDAIVKEIEALGSKVPKIIEGDKTLFEYLLWKIESLILNPTRKRSKSKIDKIKLKLRNKKERILARIESVARKITQNKNYQLKLVIEWKEEIFSIFSLHPDNKERAEFIKKKKVFYQSKVSPSTASSLSIGAITAVLISIILTL